MKKEQFFGITETSDPAFHLEIFDNLYAGNIIISKRLTKKLIEKLIEHKDKVIFHFTVTGFGGTKVEPMVPDYNTSFEKLKELLDGGFPVGQVVLRVDPVIPTEKGINLAKDVVEKFSELGIKRVRFSVLDMYKHVKERFEENGFPIPYDSFHAPIEIRKKILNMFIEFGAKYGFDVEVCGEPGIESVSCLSQKDVDILGLTDAIKLEGSKGQRKSCGCPKNKKELITSGFKDKCPNACVYCFWK